MQNNRVHAVFTSVIALWYTEYSPPSRLYLCAYKWWRKYLKLRKHTFKNIEKFFQSLMDKPVFDKSLFLPDKLICLSKTCVSNAPGSPWGMLMPAITLRMPHPRDWQREQMPRGCPGKGGGMGTAGIDWCIILTVSTNAFHSTNLSCCLSYGKKNLSYAVADPRFAPTS